MRSYRSTKPWLVRAGQMALQTGFAADALYRAGRGIQKTVGYVRRNFNYRTGNTTNRMVQKMGPMNKRSSNGGGGPPPKKVKINDMGVYQQSRRYQYRNGKRNGKLSRALKLVKAQTQKMLLRYANISDEAEPFGSTFIRNAVLTEDNTIRRYPIHIFNLFSLNQGITGAPSEYSAVPGFELRGIAATGQLFWAPIVAKAIDGVTDSLVWSKIQNSSTTTQAGRHSLIDWTRIRLHMYGKKKEPSFIKISLVKFDEDEVCPDFQLNVTTGISPTLGVEAYDFWSARLKPLVSSQIASKPQTIYRKQMKVLKEYFVNIQPIDAAAETSASDNRGHIKILDIFNRWSRVNDYQTIASDTDEGVQTDAQLADPDFMGPINLGYGGYLRDKQRAVFLLIESVSPSQLASGTSGAIASERAVSYDFNIEAKHSILGVGVV